MLAQEDRDVAQQHGFGQSDREKLAVGGQGRWCVRGTGQIERALMISPDFEELIHSADHLLQMAAILSRSLKGTTEE